MSEPTAVRWKRRATTIPVMLAATAVAVVGLPVLAPAAVVVDLVRGRPALPTLRLYGFALQYLLNDSLEILLAPFLWAAAGFGTRLGSSASRARHQRLQDWSADALARRAEQLLGLGIELSAQARARLQPGPVIVLSRHVSVLDASIPGLLYQRLGYSARGVVMAELLADPGFDLIYHRTGSVFIPRDDGPAAVDAVRSMAAGADGRTALIIFPEGRLFTPRVLERALKRLADTDPERAERFSDVTSVLPPRAGGFAALLAAVPDADVVLVDHRGLDHIGPLRNLRRLVPFDRPITVSVERYARADLPADRDGQARWLDDRWLELERRLDGAGH